MDYSLLWAIETLEHLPDRTKEKNKHNELSRSVIGGGEFLFDQEIVKTIRDSSGSLNASAEEEEEKGNEVEDLMSHRHCFIKGKRVYHIAIIDYLQEWNMQKKLERFTKTVLLGKDGPTLSAIEPEAYATRFRNFVEKHVITE